MVFSLKAIEINKNKVTSREDVIEERFSLVRGIKRIAARRSLEKFAWVGEANFLYFLFRPLAPVLTRSISTKDGYYTGSLNKHLEPDGFGCKFSLPRCVSQPGVGMGPFPNQRICAYEGWWLNGAMHGKCIYETTDGCVYRGSMHNDRKQGQGTFTWADGSAYCGLFVDDQMEGQGVHSFPSGRKYVGGFISGKRHGKGQLWLPNNSVESSVAEITFYEGDFNNGRRSGSCRQVYSDGSVYVGEVVCDKRHGSGTLTWPDGCIYHGSWLNDQRHGKGCQVRPNGSEYHGVWHKNAFQHRDREIK